MAGQIKGPHPRHDHSSMDMDMGTDTDAMSSGTINVLHFPLLYWSFVGAVIAAFAIANGYQYLLYKQRMRSSRRLQRYPSIPRTRVTISLASLTAIAREVQYASLPSKRLSRSITIQVPPTGPLILILLYIALIVILVFYDFDLSDRWMFESIAYRAGFVSLAQLPLIILLAGRNNLIGLFTGISYERLNWVHRWIARSLLLSTTIHLGYWLTNWAPYDGYIAHQVSHDPKTQKGLGAWCTLVWIVFSSFGPIRRLSYEFFVVQHVLSFIALFVVIYYHLPPDPRKWVWVALGIFMFDRASRWVVSIYNNLALAHPRLWKLGTMNRIWASRAQFTPMPGHMTKVTIRNPSINWRPGQHAFLNFHSLAPFQSHPFTISSIPQDNKLEFFIRARKGATKTIFDHAEKTPGLPTEQSSSARSFQSVAIEGPYGQIRPLQQFDSVCFVAGGSGVTFTAPLFRDIIRRWQESTPIVTKYVRFIWVFRSLEHLTWLGAELSQAVEKVRDIEMSGIDITVDMSFYITCDERLTAESSDHEGDSLLAGEQNPALVFKRPEEASEKEWRAAKRHQNVPVVEIDQRLEAIPVDKLDTCEPDMAFCCRTRIENEESSNGIACTCSKSSGTGAPHYNESSSGSDSNSLDKGGDEKGDSFSVSLTNDSSISSIHVHPSIKILSGRPNINGIVRKVLEQAEGETAVLACGPQGLREATRRSVASLSDERAVHKGSEAQGVFFWSETFGW